MPSPYLACGQTATRRNGLSRQRERNAMPQQKSIVGRFENTSVVRFGGPLLFVLLLGFSFSAMFAQQPGPRTFASPEDASRAFFDAMQKYDDQSPLSILGASGK